MRCRTAETWIVAARDGELTERQRRALDRHLAACGACRAEQVSLEGVLSALDALEPAAEVPARLEADVFRQVRGLAEGAAAPAWTLPPWLRRGLPAIAATAVVALAVVGVRSSEVTVPAVHTKVAVAERPRVATPPAPAVAKAEPEAPVVARRAKSRAPVDPPAELASRPDLFMDLPMLRELDKMQHFDTIATMEDGDGGEAPSPNG
jgi:anti-sigma factor RsiW